MFDGSSNFDRPNDYGIAVRDLPGKAVPCWKFGVSIEAMMAGALRGGMV
jgi:hypothetical protein